MKNASKHARFRLACFTPDAAEERQELGLIRLHLNTEDGMG